jgi:AcrR family transcriptional regulator
MRYTADHRDATRTAILKAAGELFRAQGFAGAGIDAIAAEAGVTSGAIYRQFASKEALFAAVVAEGMTRLSAGLTRLKGEGDEAWMHRLAAYYLGADHVNRIATGCLLPTLSIDAGRAGVASQGAYAEGFKAATGIMTGKADGQIDGEAALMLATLLGSVILARATGSEELRAALEQALGRRIAGRD